MIASFSHNFIFIKTRKTAGTSAEIVMSAWCSGSDICTPFSTHFDCEDEISRRSFGGRPSNFGAGWFLERIYLAAIRKGNAARAERIRQIAKRRGVRVSAHVAAKNVQQALPDLWNRAFKFAIERHPYERAVSKVYFDILRRNGDPMNFSLVLDKCLSEGRFANHPLYMSDGRLLVDVVIPYERMWDEIGSLAARLGTQLPARLPKAKARFHTDRRPASEILTIDQKRRIAALCGPEFELMGYEH